MSGLTGENKTRGKKKETTASCSRFPRAFGIDDDDEEGSKAIGQLAFSLLSTPKKKIKEQKKKSTHHSSS